MQEETSSAYVISLKGQLDKKWSVWFAGFEITTTDSDTLLIGQIEDQSALHGLLRKIRDAGLNLNYIKKMAGPNDE
ncbi:hypothetical protein KO525_10920 [Psychrosphaera sp. B3R10]|uniref:hypothetical protein n=1 Tax=unclassified Psychrosphaera TaxID=2641570 RepID=UPI001C09BFC3|nr:MULTISPECIES: hypothetical protein [unclassified Psychrosphaera]MBU2881871.1 hypothetical protein [Psychrosphaera sp. I2R16]MBU2989892.1 hypothetical protein [Psychrosphaera sp. B3R10]MDO6720932.1 hypothetical protein [Psychrosphaera sp. 1_MG-2023]